MEAEESKPITRFICHKSDRALARKTIDKLTASADSESAKLELAQLPLETKGGVIKNRLVGMTPEDEAVFAIHMKSGRSLNPADCLLKTVA
jgi:hypothetical protein